MANAAKIILNVKNLKMYYGNTETNIVKALDNVDLVVEKGEFVGVMGSSGSGKSSLLNILATINNPTSGHVWLDNIDISNMDEKQLAAIRNEKIGIIFQDYNLLDTLTIYENIAIALMFQKNKRTASVEESINNLADRLGIKEILNRYPYEVSGGQKQRCACARALIKEPDIILADEPTGALDTKSARELLDSFQMMNAELKSTILMVTHDPVSASCCNRVLIMKDGRIEKSISKNGKDRKEFLQLIMEEWRLS